MTTEHTIHTKQLEIDTLNLYDDYIISPKQPYKLGQKVYNVYGFGEITVKIESEGDYSTFSTRVNGYPWGEGSFNSVKTLLENLAEETEEKYAKMSCRIEEARHQIINELATEMFELIKLHNAGLMGDNSFIVIVKHLSDVQTDSFNALAKMLERINKWTRSKQ